MYVRLEKIISSLKDYEFSLTPEMTHFFASAVNHTGTHYSFKKLEAKLIHREVDRPHFVFSSNPNDALTHQMEPASEEEGDADYAFDYDEQDPANKGKPFF